MLSYWASVITALGMIYAMLASLWTTLFNRAVIKHGIVEDNGYRIGRALHWRLPFRVALIIGLLSATPIPAVIFLKDWLAIVYLVAVTGVIVSLWLFASPGMQMLYAEQIQKDGQLIFALKRSRNVIRSLLVFILFGLIPALGIGTVIHKMVG